MSKYNKARCATNCSCICHDTGGSGHDHDGQPCPGKTMRDWSGVRVKNFNRVEVLKVLLNLGNTPDEIAHTLAFEGIKGIPGSPWHCPIKKYVQKHFKHLYISVNRTSLSALSRCPKVLFDRVELPIQIANFVLSFDMKLYKELIS